MDIDVEALRSREANAIRAIIKSMRCPNPLALCGLCEAYKFCQFLSDLEEKCREICESTEGV